MIAGAKSDEAKHHLRAKVNEYMDRAEAIRKLIDEQKESNATCINASACTEIGVAAFKNPTKNYIKK